jgi:hypothetical protein
MKARSGWRWIRGPLLVALLVGLMTVPESLAKGPKGGRPGGRGGRAPRYSAPRRPGRAPNAKAPHLPHAAAPARNNQAGRGNNMTTQPRVTNARTDAHQTHPNNTGGLARSGAAAGTTMKPPSPNSYTYGTGNRARQYHAYGYGHGYRNRSGGAGYGRSQGTSRAIVSRLRSVHTALARLGHDYRGHRVKAMHAISMAIRQLSHRSMVYSAGGFASVGATGRNGALANRNGNNGNRRNTHLTQAQSDSRMSHALRTTQGIHRQLVIQGQSSRGHARARAHVAHAIHEMNTALTIR